MMHLQMQGGIEHLSLRLRCKQILHEGMIGWMYCKRLEQAIDAEDIRAEVEVKRTFSRNLTHRDADRFGWPHSIFMPDHGIGDIKQPAVLLPPPVKLAAKIVKRQLRRLFDILRTKMQILAIHESLKRQQSPFFPMAPDLHAGFGMFQIVVSGKTILQKPRQVQLLGAQVDFPLPLLKAFTLCLKL